MKITVDRVELDADDSRPGLVYGHTVKKVRVAFTLRAGSARKLLDEIVKAQRAVTRDVDDAEARLVLVDVQGTTPLGAGASPDQMRALMRDNTGGPSKWPGPGT